MSTKRIFEISDELFGGYRVEIDITYMDSYSHIYQLVKDSLRQYFLERNLQQLANKVSHLHFHIHNSPDNVKNLTSLFPGISIIYLCTNC